MNVNVHIERLILEGHGGADVHRIEAAIRAEMTRLWSVGDGILPTAKSEAFVRAAPVMHAGTGGEQLGRAIANSVYGAIAK